MSDIGGFINPDLQPRVPKYRVSTPLSDISKVAGRQQANMFNTGIKAGNLNPFNGLGRGAATVAGGASVPLTVASALIPLAEATGQQQVASGQDMPTQFSTQTKPFSGLGWEKPGQSYATGSISPVKQEVNTNFGGVKPNIPITPSAIAPFDMSGFEDKQMKFLMDEFGDNEDARRQGLADEFGNWGVAKIGDPAAKQDPPETLMPKALPYDPRFEMANKANYAQATQAIDSRMQPALGRMNGLLDEFRNYTPTGKSSIGAQTALNAIMGLTPQVANLHAAHAGDIGKLPLMEMGQSAMHQGALPMQQSQLDLFKEGLPSTQAHINQQNAEATKAKTGNRLGLIKAALMAKQAEEKGNYGTGEKQKQINDLVKQYSQLATPESQQFIQKRIQALEAMPDHLFANTRYNTDVEER